MQYPQFLALAYKIPYISSFNFLQKIKVALQKEGLTIDKIGFSGTLDPFARGQLLIAVNRYTKLFPHINKDYKTYLATVFLGCQSASLDTENILAIKEVKTRDLQQIKSALHALKGRMNFTPPKFSAKHINGVRAYQLARANKDFCLPQCVMDIKECQLLTYNHPFISFKITMSEGGFVRSIAERIGQFLECNASLCYLERLSEGNLAYHKCVDSDKIIPLQFDYNGMRQKLKLVLIDIQNALKYDTINLIDYAKEAWEGKKIYLDNTHANTSTSNKIYLADFGKHYGIIEITTQREIKYIVNRIDKC
ncbi:tRNA pseudouridine(55) synthase TruB [Helicobacter aurati]|uniref:tRNA pseudouridine(55) synthase n=1 Tax=Helicobacter aurati TaxID=137778 RepID=A0A3D8J8A5_9HELI|nr:tRNA pseudouridine(55) synthase TruB [Helicobacter aurati]RDU73091.1 tRNA pseudouridine(55) synthase TruB [Helicobacter aurati]